MTAVTEELDWQLGLAPEVRMALYGYQGEFGALPATMWRVPGTVTLLARGPHRLTVTAPGGAIAAAGPGEDGVLELIRTERPSERERVTAADRAPSWATGWPGFAAEPGRVPGVRLVLRSELPDGSGAGTRGAAERALRLCLGDPTAHRPDLGLAAGFALLGGQRLPCDLAAAGLRLMLIDPRVRREPLGPVAEDSPVTAAATVVAEGDFAALGALLTAAHESHPGDAEQQAAVSAALRGGALGARALTDGPGRPVCVLAPLDAVAAVRAAVAADFDQRGDRPPRCLTFTPGPGPDQPAPL
jgi:galactokinase